MPTEAPPQVMPVSGFLKVFPSPPHLDVVPWRSSAAARNRAGFAEEGNLAALPKYRAGAEWHHCFAELICGVLTRQRSLES